MDIQGVEQLNALAKALKEAGDKGLQRELSKGIRNAVKPFKDRVVESAMETLPSGGGLNALVAARVRRARIRRSANGVQVVAAGSKGMKDLAAIDAGSVRHPVFGNRAAWVSQDVTPGFWSDAEKESAPEAAKGVVQAMETVRAKIDGSV